MNRRKALALLVALSISFSGCGAQAAIPGEVLPPQVESASEGSAASESPAQKPMECRYYERETCEAAMAAPRAYTGAGRLTAGMVPHHLVAADMIAGFFSLAAAQEQPYDTVILVSPSHFPENCGSDVVTATADWNTPYGSLATDRSVADALLQDAVIAAEDNRDAVESDHGAAGLVPFVRRYLPEAKLAVCLLSNRLSRERLAQVQRVLLEQQENGRTLLVASADCSHYLMPDEAARRDGETAAAIESRDFERLLTFGDANIDSPQAVTTFLCAAQGNGDVVRLDHSSSAEKLPHAMGNPIYDEGITTYFVYGIFA
ncbi:AmmeMemoRadiSam system protein B [Clostridiaceae bacterium NSJ-31]|uniref:AmmeMemoRadiSam system protein B n=1 Tax=Ligaoa zhengdingensis TaxID=2763658 RepID=A0A926DXK8_9FIRM|nr:AmmeMemoRadiSam system protein B [Ligaoa zhengdingensis]MBC8545697.1 AmmeMemoRadiSam system protein B [Ligaoa zhengdingensis]